MVRMRYIITIIALCICSVTKAPAEAPTPTDATAKALGYLQSEGQKWIDHRGCVSCHQVPAMLWSLHAAAGAGLEVPEENLQEWTRWSTEPVSFVKPAQKKDLDVDKTLAGNIDTMAALLLAIPQTDQGPWRQQFVDALCDQQAENGSWKPCGQLPLQKRDKRETAQATTLWVTLALLTQNAADFDVERAITFADTDSDGQPVQPQSTEWYAARLLVAHQRDAQTSRPFQRRLLEQQNEDGGWGWLVNEPSDALATGLALYALAVSESDAAAEIKQARSFLAKAQTDAGSWRVPGTKKAAKGKPTATANYWGTAWAVVGLLRSAP